MANSGPANDASHQPGAPSSGSPSTFDRWRGPIATLFLVIFMVSAGIAVPVIWARNQLLDTDRFVRTVAPLGDEPAFQNAIATRLSQHVSDGVASTSIVSENDGVLSSLLPAVTTVAVDTLVRNFVSSPSFPETWEETARVAHSGFVALVDGSESPYFDSANGQVVVDLTPIAQRIADDLAVRGITVELPQRDLTFPIFQSELLADMQSVTRYVEELAIILPVVALVALLGYILLSTNRRGAIVVASLGLAITMLVLLLFLLVARWSYLGALDDNVDQTAAKELFDILFHYLRIGLRMIGLISIGIAALAWIGFRRHIHLDTSSAESDFDIYRRWPALGRAENAIATNRRRSSVVWLSLVILVLLLLMDWEETDSIAVLIVVGLAGLVLIRRTREVPAELLAASDDSGALPAARPVPNISQSLQQVADLRTQNLLSEEEFARAKAAILSGA